MTTVRDWSTEDLVWKAQVDSGSATEVDFSCTTKELWIWGNNGSAYVTLSSTLATSVFVYPPHSEVAVIEGIKVNNLRSNKVVYYAGWY
jgi:hypothetical protein